jgi:hypothetical protein
VLRGRSRRRAVKMFEIKRGGNFEKKKINK